jgi:hypothetical protein
MQPPNIFGGYYKTLARALWNELSRALDNASLHHILVHALRSFDGEAWHVIPLYHLHCRFFHAARTQDRACCCIMTARKIPFRRVE